MTASIKRRKRDVAGSNPACGTHRTNSGDQMADVASLLGYGAGILIAIAYVPQVVRAYRSKSTKDLSKLWLVILVVGDLAWLAYGVALASLPLIASNGVLLVLTAALLAMKLRYG